VRSPSGCSCRPSPATAVLPRLASDKGKRPVCVNSFVTSPWEAAIS
jgi:hypothetical protein